MRILVLDDHYLFTTSFIRIVEYMGVGDVITNQVPDLCVLDDFDIIFANVTYLPLETKAYVCGMSSVEYLGKGAHSFLKKPFSIQQIKDVINDSQHYPSRI